MDNKLPVNARAAWSAYIAMGISKQRHFDFLQQLAEKYRDLHRPSVHESAQLKSLLQEHDTQVRVFREALQNLKFSDPDAYAALVKHLATANTALDSRAPSSD